MKGFNRMRVVGGSMNPSVREGVIIYTRPYFFWERIQIGDVVVLRDPREPSRKIVKRIAKTVGNSYIVLGDNTNASTDSRAFGGVTREAILGKALVPSNS